MSTKKQDQSPQGEPAPENVTSPQPQRRTKQSLLLELIGREGGATLEELTSVTECRCARIDGVSRYMVGNSNQ